MLHKHANSELYTQSLFHSFLLWDRVSLSFPEHPSIAGMPWSYSLSALLPCSRDSGSVSPGPAQDKNFNTALIPKASGHSDKCW